MKIKAEENFIDRKTKKRIKAGTEVSADKKRLELLDKHGIKYEVVSEKSTQKKPKTTAKSTKKKETR